MSGEGSTSCGSNNGFSATKIAVTWHLVVVWMRVSARRPSSAIEIRLCLFQTSNRRTSALFLRVANGGTDFTSPIAILDATGRNRRCQAGEALGRLPSTTICVAPLQSAESALLEFVRPRCKRWRGRSARLRGQRLPLLGQAQSLYERLEPRILAAPIE